MRLRKVGLASLMLVLFLFPGCKKSPQGAFRTIRFIDLLGTGNILQSPFKKQADKQSRAFLEPLKSAPLPGLASPENPYNLKKKLDLGTCEIETLFAPPKSKYV